MQKPEVDATYLRAFISVEHVSAKPPVVMPNLQLLDSERDAIVAYMLKSPPTSMTGGVCVGICARATNIRT